MKALLILVIIEYLILNVLFTIDLIRDYKEFRAIVIKPDERSRINQEHWDSLGEVEEKGGK